MRRFSELIKGGKENPREPPKASGRKYCFAKAIGEDEEKRLVFGWASVAVTVDGEEVVDRQDDVIEPEELENAAYNFVEFYRKSGEMHERSGFDVGVLIESVVFTPEKLKAMEIPDDIVPNGWWVGFHIYDDNVWESVKSGEYSMFSIGGKAIRTEIEDPSTNQ